MMKKISKLTSVLIAVLMLFSVGVSAFAEDAAAALPPEKGSLTIHKYLMEDISKAATPNNGYEAGTNGNEEIPADATPLNGITFDLYKVII